MDIITQAVDDITILRLKGWLNASSAEQFKNNIKDLVTQKKIYIVVDMRDVGFVDSSGLGVLVASLRATTQEGGDICLCMLKPEVMALFELTRLHKLFEIYETDDAAIEYFKSK